MSSFSMNHIFFSFYTFLCMISVNAVAETNRNEQIDNSEIEAQERLQIISELTYHLETRFTCKQTLKWDDGGSGADLDGYFYIPVVGQSEYIIGGYATQKENASNNCVVTVSEPPDNPQGSPHLLVTPVDWKQIWKDKGAGARKDGSMWQAVPPNSNYTCLGTIPQSGYNKPNLPDYRCVHSSLTEKIVTNSIIWSDRGSGADHKVTMFKLTNTGSFTTVPARMSKIEAYDLKANVFVLPDAHLVDLILSKRMKEIKIGLDAQIEAQIEKEMKAVEKTQLAKNEEQKKLDEAKKNQSVAIEKQKRLAEAEKKQSSENEVQKRLEEAEKARLAKDEEQKQLEVAKIQLAKNEEQRRLEEAEKTRLAEEPDKTEEASTNNDNAITDDDKKESKDITDLITHFLIVFSLLIGLIIFLVIIYKFIKGSKIKNN